MKSSVAIISVLLMIAGNAFAQESGMALHLFGNADLPNGDFGKAIGDRAKITRRSGFDIGEKAGLAQTGFGGGAELISPVWFKGLNWVFSTRMIINGSDVDIIQSEFRSELGDSVDLEFEFGHWINIPIMTGFRYDLQFVNGYALYGILQAGINWSRAPSRKATVGDLTVEETRYEFARDFGIELGLGVIFARRYNLGVRYLALSTPRYEGTRKLSEKMFPEIFKRETAILGEERSISMFVVTLGLQLF